MYGLIYGVDGANFPDVAESGPYATRADAIAAVDADLVRRHRGVGLVSDWAESDGRDIATGRGRYAGSLLSIEHVGSVTVIEIDPELGDTEAVARSHLGAEISREDEIVADSGRLRYPLVRWVRS